MTVTVRSWSDAGPYYAPLTGKYQASSLKELISLVRCSMEENEQCIGIFHDNECKGFWEDESEPEPDGEGGWAWPHVCYVLRRPSASPHFDKMVRLMRQA
jgi:hypothetical protein